MNDPKHEPNLDHDDEWIESMLRADAHAHDGDYLADDGFTARVMQALPASVTLPAWRKPLLAGMWGAAGVGLAVVLPDTLRDAAQDVIRFVVTQHFSLRDIGVAVLAVAGASWAGTLYALRQER